MSDWIFGCLEKVRGEKLISINRLANGAIELRFEKHIVGFDLYSEVYIRPTEDLPMCVICEMPDDLCVCGEVERLRGLHRKVIE